VSSLGVTAANRFPKNFGGLRPENHMPADAATRTGADALQSFWATNTAPKKPVGISNEPSYASRYLTDFTSASGADVLRRWINRFSALT
jgi:hypothetical protein